MKTVYLVASGDLRLSANQNCWAAQAAMEQQVGARLAAALRRNKAIMGIFDEGCMGMYNAIIPDELLNSIGIYKERLSQSALFARMRTVSYRETRGVYDWLLARGMRFTFGADDATDSSPSTGPCTSISAAAGTA